jgi:hypothetical protein
MQKCAREECGKTVYPTEELKCLDKVWHKICFKCTSCGMALNMKNYKGYDKKPYCDAHYPKTVASVVVDTPEMQRLKQNTEFQSQVKYHAQYEKMKGIKTEITDDPELMRHLKNTKAQSLVQYHGEQEKKRAQDEHRPNEQLTHDLPSSTSITSFPTSAVDENALSTTNRSSYSSYNSSSLSRNNGNNGSSYISYPTQAPSASQHQQSQQDFSPYTQRLTMQAGTTVYSSENGGRVPTEQRQVGSIADYDPLNGEHGTTSVAKNAEKIATAAASAANQRQQQQSDARRESQTSTTTGKTTQAAGSQKTSSSATTGSTSPTKTAANANQQPAAGGGAPAQARPQTGFTVKALYDYTAADTDEVSFKENDIIVNCAKVDDGWMTGTVQRTLTWGMLPANYVERVNQPTGLFKLT